MKILVVCQHYWPEPYYLSDVCEELVRRGHAVHVVTDVPNYPMGYIYDDYKNGKNREQLHNGVKISRTFTIGRRKGDWFRLFNYYSYSISSTLYVNKLPGDYDVVFTNQTSPVMMTEAASSYSRKWGKKCVMYCMDLWPASLVAGGMKTWNPIYKFFGKVSNRLYNRADQILITSQMFREYLEKNHKIPSEKIVYFPQYAASQFENLPQIEGKETIDFVFAGNVGKAQSLETLLNAVKILDMPEYEGKSLKWHIVGDGSRLENLKKQAACLGLSNVIFHGRKPSEEMPEYYAMADAMLVLLTADPYISRTLPGKVQTYMAAGKPVLAAADGETPRVLENAECGYASKAEDPQQFAEIVKKFLENKERARLGINAKNYYKNNFAREQFMQRLENILIEAAK